MMFNLEINSDVFNNLYLRNENSLDGRDLEEKIIDLYSVECHLIDYKPETFDITDTSPMMSTNQIQTRAGTWSGWYKLITDLNKYGSVNLKNYSGIDKDALKYSGWTHEWSWDPLPYQMVAYSRWDGNCQLVYLTLLDITTKYDNINSVSGNASIQAKIHLGMVVRYYPSTENVEVFYYNWPLSFNQFKVGMNCLSNYAIFTDRTINFVGSRNTKDTIAACISLYGPASTVSDIFENLYNKRYQSLNRTEDFENTYEKQYQRHGGKIIRGIMSDTEKSSLRELGDYTRVGGRIRLYSEDHWTNWYYGFSYTAYTQ